MSFSTLPPDAYQWDVLGVGSCAVDDRLYLDHFPQPDIKMPIQKILRLMGGQTSTALVAASHQGARTGFLTCLGENDLSNSMRRELDIHGVDLSLVQNHKDSQPFYTVILLDSLHGTRTILYSNEGVVEPDPNSILPEWISAARVIFIDQNTPIAGLYAAKLARKKQKPVVADIERTSIPGLEALLSTVDHLIVNMGFAREYSGRNDPGKMISAITRPGQSTCIVTGGAQGCWVSTAGEVHHIPAFSVKVVDTTGCGDVFHGVYAAALARGQTVLESVRLASAAAALKAASGAGWNGIPDHQMTLDFLGQYE